MITQTFAEAWEIYRKHFGIIAAAVVIVWLPLELLSSYLNAFVFDPEDVRRSFNFSRFLDNFAGIVATGAVISVGYVSALGEQPTFRHAMATGLTSWWRMWWTRLLTMLFVLASFLALILPGFYMLVRLAFVEQIVICERRSGLHAIRRGFEVTEGKFWKVFLFGVVLVTAMIALAAVVLVPASYIPAFEHWLLDATLSLVVDVIGAFGTLVLISGYVMLAKSPEEGEIAA